MALGVEVGVGWLLENSTPTPLRIDHPLCATHPKRPSPFARVVCMVFRNSSFFSSVSIKGDFPFYDLMSHSIIKLVKWIIKKVQKINIMLRIRI